MLDILEIIKDNHAIIPNAHIVGIRILQGDDDYNYTDLVTIKPNHKYLDVKSAPLFNAKSHYRLRYEPQIEIIYQFEGSEKINVLTISHHKGNLYFDNK